MRRIKSTLAALAALAVGLTALLPASAQEWKSEKGETELYFVDTFQIEGGSAVHTNAWLYPYRLVLAKYNLPASTTSAFTMVNQHHSRTPQYATDIRTNWSGTVVSTNRIVTNTVVTVVASNVYFNTATTDAVDVVVQPSYADDYICPGDVQTWTLGWTGATYITIYGER